ncbi:9-cis-epoxycarotenoid dioxygenase NCED2, chloroplastic-like isoform X2 [Magnolia sinica]|uniref:9-cis-epoxycarotenoid dioxygenase NCED2, chloroplastic-like isoform X2 n=1 Tax=Magnolia sinica TaxID=86752 RepID=UPI00265B2E3D|nr:9-cis-epoxycarotenoid dioxygenase NCED2, chloroplastic-like isoform X2 [Magnolia sinica]
MYRFEEQEAPVSRHALESFLPNREVGSPALNCRSATEMVKGGKLIFSFDATKKARFGVLPRYAKDELQIRWFELPNCFIFHNGDDDQCIEEGTSHAISAKL